MVSTDSTSLHSFSQLSPEDPASFVIGRGPEINRLSHHVERAAQVECTVLVTGETGTGKEVWARLLQQLGPRREQPFVPVNCAALTANLAESQLFGHVRGAFTGAAGESLGVFRAADRGIIFLDEVGDMPLELQPKLLRVLQEGEVTPVGSAQPVYVDVQIIAATNRNLERDVAEGHFREDLYYRLNLVELQMPPLRDRIEDIPTFIEYFSRKFATRYEQPIWQPGPETLRSFCAHRWPGNIRQLGFVIEQAYVLQCDPVLPGAAAGSTAADSTAAGRAQPTSLPFTDLDRLRRTAVEQALRATRGHKGHAAELLGVHPNTMTRLASQLADA
jgi:DNA-binding NtrC family response regulator